MHKFLKIVLIVFMTVSFVGCGVLVDVPSSEDELVKIDEVSDVSVPTVVTTDVPSVENNPESESVSDDSEPIMTGSSQDFSDELTPWEPKEYEDTPRCEVNDPSCQSPDIDLSQKLVDQMQIRGPMHLWDLFTWASMAVVFLHTEGEDISSGPPGLTVDNVWNYYEDHVGCNVVFAGYAQAVITNNASINTFINRVARYRFPQNAYQSQAYGVSVFRGIRYPDVGEPVDSISAAIVFCNMKDGFTNGPIQNVKMN